MKIKKIIESCILCIRFPFLYPRNRFTGLHYTNWKLHAFHTKWWSLTEDWMCAKFTTESVPLSCRYNIGDRSYWMCVNKENKLQVYVKLEGRSKDKLILEEDLSKFASGKCVKCGWNNSIPTIIMSEDSTRTASALFIKYVHAPLLRNFIKFVDWIHEYPIQWLHCIPTYTELDAMETGWRKAFGIQMCKEIKAELKKHPGLMKKYRITQIKEKYGSLRWYDSFSTKEIFDIISKYEDISTTTCIVCGKPATKISTGWICPYCDEHIGDRGYTEIK